MSDDDLEALREQTSHGDRIDHAADEAARQALVDDILAELEAIDRGDEQKTVSVWDGPLAAFIRALEDNPEEMEAVGHALQSHLGVDEDDVGRSELLRLALRVGFEEAAPDAFDAVREAARQQAAKNL